MKRQKDIKGFLKEILKVIFVFTPAIVGVYTIGSTGFPMFIESQTLVELFKSLIVCGVATFVGVFGTIAFGALVE